MWDILVTTSGCDLYDRIQMRLTLVITTCLCMAMGMGWTGCDSPTTESTLTLQPPPEPDVDAGRLHPRILTVIEVAIDAVNDTPGDHSARLELAQLYHGNELPRQAAVTYRQAIALDHDAPRAWYGLSLLLESNGRINEAIDAIGTVIDMAPEYAPATWRHGYLLLDLGQFDEAKRAFERTLRIEPRNAAAIVGLSRTALATGRPALAAEHIETVRGYANSPYLDFLLGQAYRRLGRVDDAALLLANVQGVAPDFEDPWELEILDRGESTQARINRIDRLIDSAELLESMNATRAALKDEPDHMVLLNRLSHIQNAMGNHKASLRTLKRALRVDEHYAPTHLGLSYRYHAGDEIAKARAHAGRAIAINPNLARAHLQLGLMLILENDPHAAVESLGRAFALGVQDVPSRHQYAHALTRIGRFDDATRQYRLVLLLNRNDGRSWAGLADVQLLLNKVDEARESLLMGLACAPDSPHLKSIADAIDKRLGTASNRASGP
ncbi:MAG: hypothetical protein CMJ24_03770 [Phycisphaerae bacterium]|nr:hypothetical protein [Phycisphaerae bacterium]